MPEETRDEYTCLFIDTAQDLRLLGEHCAAVTLVIHVFIIIHNECRHAAASALVALFAGEERIKLEHEVVKLGLEV